jgi:hypothetical protein
LSYAYDFTDQAIRVMVMNTHTPAELWVHASDGSFLDTVQCSVDRREWPCSAQLGLRAFFDDIEAEGLKACRPLASEEILP